MTTPPEFIPPPIGHTLQEFIPPPIGHTLQDLRQNKSGHVVCLEDKYGTFGIGEVFEVFSNGSIVTPKGTVCFSTMARFKRLDPQDPRGFGWSEKTSGEYNVKIFMDDAHKDTTYPILGAVNINKENPWMPTRWNPTGYNQDGSNWDLIPTVRMKDVWMVGIHQYSDEESAIEARNARHPVIKRRFPENKTNVGGGE